MLKRVDSKRDETTKTSTPIWIFLQIEVAGVELDEGLVGSDDKKRRVGVRRKAMMCGKIEMKGRRRHY